MTCQRPGKEWMDRVAGRRVERRVVVESRVSAGEGGGAVECMVECVGIWGE
ncbi:hypothetical protein Hanom_Chr10g00935871 [Helianthus anomalus]